MPVGIIINAFSVLLGGLIGAVIRDSISAELKYGMNLTLGCCATTMSFNKKYTPERRQKVHSRATRILELFAADENLDVAVQHPAVMDETRIKRSELHTFSVLPKRWIVKRSSAWLDKYRKLWINCAQKSQNSFHMISPVFIRLLLKRY